MYDVMRAYRIVSADRRTHYDERLLPFAEKILKEIDANAHRQVSTDRVEYLPEELVPGMVLAEDIRTGTGILVLPAGTTLTREHIAALKRYFALDPAAGAIRVWKKNLSDRRQP